MDVSLFAPLVGMGINLTPPVVIMTIIIARWVLWMLAEKDGVLNHPALRVTVPFATGIILFLVWKFSTAEIIRSDLWDGFINAAVSVGLYAPVRSYLQSKGFGPGANEI